MSRLYAIPFGSDLIDEVVKIINEDANGYEGTAVVFPGKRPSLYLKARLAGASGGKAFFPPRSFSLDEFIDHIARRRRPAFADLDRADAVWLLHGLIRSLSAFDHHPFRKKGFGDFFYWGKYLLDFIDRLDTEGIGNSTLLDVEKNAAIGYDVPASVNELLANVSILRKEFHGLLGEKGWFTRGTKYLAALEEIREDVPGDPGTVLFAGIFGLTGIEREIIKCFWDSGRATLVLEGNPENWPILKDLISYLKATAEHIGTGEPRTPAIHLHAGYDAHAEVLETHRIIGEGTNNKTAIVLPVSDPLFPLLNFVIDRTELHCNISMGYPVERTALFDLVRHILNARIQKRSDGHYPAGEYLAVMLHPFIKNLTSDTGLRGLLLHIERSLTGENRQSAIAGRALVTLGQIEGEAAAWTAPPGKGTAGGAAVPLQRSTVFSS